MRRVAFDLPRPARFITQDLVHDAVVAGFEAAGVPAARLMGKEAAPWTFAALGSHGRYDPAKGQRPRFLRTLILSTPDAELAQAMERLDGSRMAAARALAGESLSLEGASRREIADPIAPGQTTTAVFWLSPCLVKRRLAPGEKSSPWIVDPRVIEQQDMGQRLARAVGRDVALRWRADSLAVRSLPHRFNTDIKVHPKTGRAVSVAGTVLPFVMEGTEDALRLAWYAGLGSKTRMGFGCWDVQPQGMGEGEGA